MKKYAKSSVSPSTVDSYEIGSDRITVQFEDGHAYLYTYASAGRENVEQMKVLAMAGHGLGTFINANVRKRYETKIR